MHLQDLDPAGAVRCLHGDAPVNTTGPEQRRIEDLRTVGRAEHHHRLV